MVFALLAPLLGAAALAGALGAAVGYLQRVVVERRRSIIK